MVVQARKTCKENTFSFIWQWYVNSYVNIKGRLVK